MSNYMKISASNLPILIPKYNENSQSAEDSSMHFLPCGVVYGKISIFVSYILFISIYLSK